MSLDLEHGVVIFGGGEEERKTTFATWDLCVFIGVGVIEAEMSFVFIHFAFNMVELNIPHKPEAWQRYQG